MCPLPSSAAGGGPRFADEGVMILMDRGRPARGPEEGYFFVMFQNTVTGASMTPSTLVRRAKGWRY